MVISADWKKIKNEYVSTNISQRKIAEKYGVSYNTLKVRSTKEKWADERKKVHSKIIAKSQQKTIEKLAEKQAQETVDGVDNINLAISQLNKLLILMQSADVDIGSPQRKQSKRENDGIKIVKEDSGIDKALKIAKAVGGIIRDSDVAIEAISKHTQKAETPALQKAREILGGVHSVIE